MDAWNTVGLLNTRTALMAFLETLQSLLETPTAPYREQWMMKTVRAELDSIPGVEICEDKWGNIAARLRRGESSPPIAFVAHLDHPGFIVPAGASGGDIEVVFEGGVLDGFFPEGRVRLYRSPDDPGTSATISEMGDRVKGGDRNRTGRLKVDGDADGAVLAMWDVDPFRVEGDIIYGRAIDDLGGVAAIVESLRRIAERSEPVDFIALFTRGEESGFRGTIALCLDEDRERLLPNNSQVISIETSSARPATPVGGGAILRIGDKTTVFDSEMCRMFGEITKEQASVSGRRPLVRALMDGGSCEASAFNLFGYRSAGMCLPLGNYHNMDVTNQIIAPEYISNSDAEDLISTIVEVSLADRTGVHGLEKLKAEYRELGERGMEKLSSTAR